MGARWQAWQDDFWTLVLALPLVLAFVPGCQDLVSRGFVIIAQDLPGWYQGGVAAAIAWAFGKRALRPMGRGRI